MFARPRPKKSLAPPPKKRKTSHAIEEISFDNDARADYLTGFHKRKVQRTKHAQEEATKMARQEKIEMRKQLKEERKREVEEHVQHVEAILKEAELAGSVSDRETSDADEAGEWGGIADAPAIELVDHEEEYIDEDKYTTVTVESVSVSRDGLLKPEQEMSKENQGSEQNAADAQPPSKGKPEHPKKKKQKFRYETKAERSAFRKKQKVKKMKARE